MEPRDESLLRKAKVREILKTFQEEQPEEQKQPGIHPKLKRGQNQGSLDTKFYQYGNFGEQFNRIEKQDGRGGKKSSSYVPGLFNNLQGDLINHTHYVGKPIIVQQQNRV